MFSILEKLFGPSKKQIERMAFEELLRENEERQEERQIDDIFSLVINLGTLELNHEQYCVAKKYARVGLSSRSDMYDRQEAMEYISNLYGTNKKALHEAF